MDSNYCSLLLGLLNIAATISSGPKIITTWIGSSLIVASCIMLAVNNWKLLKRFNQLDACSNREFLVFIERTRENQSYYFKKTQGRIMLLCSIGLLLYLYELATFHPAWTVLLYIACTAYLLIAWFVLRPRMFKRNAKKLKNLRLHFEKLTRQLENHEQ